MAADCATRVWALAIATAACVGLPAALVYAMVRILAARRYGATFALGLFLVFWVTVSAAYYPRIFTDLVPCLRLRMRLRRAGGPRGPTEPSLLVPQPPSFAVTEIIMHGGRGGGGGRVMGGAASFPWEQPPAAAPAVGVGPRLVGVVPTPSPYLHQLWRVPLPPPPQGHGGRGGGAMLFPWEESTTSRAWDWEASISRGGGARASTDDGDDDDIPPPPPPPRYPWYEQQRVALVVQMAALPREPPAARVGADDGDDDAPRRPPCGEQSDGGPSRYCAICLADVDEEGTAKRLPLCLHVFHRQCIDQWLRGHSTCPICRCNAVLTNTRG